MVEERSEKVLSLGFFNLLCPQTAEETVRVKSISAVVLVEIDHASHPDLYPLSSIGSAQKLRLGFFYSTNCTPSISAEFSSRVVFCPCPRDAMDYFQ